MNNWEILKRLYKDYTKNFRYKILLSIFFTLLVASSTAAIAYLLDPAIKKLLVEKKSNTIINNSLFHSASFYNERNLTLYGTYYNDRCW